MTEIRKNLRTGITIALVLALIALSIVLGGAELSGGQLETLKILLIICGCSAAYCFIAGEATRNYSQMDRLWSILPALYTWLIALRGGMRPRLIAFALIVTAWGIRLTINFGRKGAYRLRFWEGKEDYRWSIVHQSPVFRHGALWTLFNLLFISLYQNLLVLAICLPALAAMDSEAGFGLWDALAAVLAVMFLALETVADEYQWKFHEEKKRLLASGKRLEELPAPYDLGFNTLGPWAYMRHPNYVGEQGIWLSLYLFAIGAGVANGVFHWSATGALLLILLFTGSSSLGESISAGKYPRYNDYVNQVFKYLPIRKWDSGH